MAACASPVQASSEDPARVARIQHACRDTMQLYPGEADYEDCILSLKQTMASIDQAAAVEQQRQQCFSQGLQSGTPEFARCVLAGTKY